MPYRERSARRTSRASRGGRSEHGSHGRASSSRAGALDTGAHLAHGGARAHAARGLAPVLVGTVASRWVRTTSRRWLVAALLGAVFIRSGRNVSNDYSDARRGADTEDRSARCA